MKPAVVLDKKSQVLVVDDYPAVLDTVSSILREYGYDVIGSDSAAEALAIMDEINIGVVLSDIKMPKNTGLDLLAEIKLKHPDIPVILMTAYVDFDSAVNAVKKGAFDFIIKPFKPESLVPAVEKAMDHFRLLQIEKEQRLFMEQTLKERSRELLDALAANKHLSGEISRRLITIAEFRDCETGAHISRMGDYSREMASALGMPQDFIETIAFASPMHDIGKVGIPDNVLLKTGGLTPLEFEIMKTHTLKGYNLLSGSLHKSIQMAASVALNHHERWDGTGYPRGLKGEDIPIEGRIVMVCDCYDALRSKRPYKKPYTHEEAVRIITHGDDRTMPGHFDPQVLETFLRIEPVFDRIFSNHKEEHLMTKIADPYMHPRISLQAAHLVSL